MADTVRPTTDLQTLFADNTSGQISAQDVRDVLVSTNDLPQTVVVRGDDSSRSTRATAVQDAIDRAETLSSSSEVWNVLVPGSFGPDTDGYDASAVNFSGSGGTWSGRMVRESGSPGGDLDPVAYGASPSGTAQQNTDALTAAKNYAKAQGGGTVRFKKPGTYEFASNGTNPYDSNKQYILDVDTDDFSLIWDLGTTFKLAAGQMNDTDGAVEFVVYKDRSNISVTVATVDGNFSNQTNFTSGRSQTSSGNFLRGYESGTGGNSGIALLGYGPGLSTIQDLGSNPMFNGSGSISDGETGNNSDMSCVGLEVVDCGEGPNIKQCVGAHMDRLLCRDPSNVWVGDGFEFAECDEVTFGELRCEADGGSGGGTALDIFASKNVQGERLRADGWTGGLEVDENNDATPRQPDDVQIANMNLSGLTSSGIQHRLGDLQIGNLRINGVGAQPIISGGGGGAGTVGSPRITVSSFILDDPDDSRNGVTAKGPTEMIFDFFRVLDSAGTVVRLEDPNQNGAPHFEWRAGKTEGSNANGILVDGGGSAIAPTGYVGAVDLSSTTTAFAQQSSGVWDNLRVSGEALPAEKPIPDGTSVPAVRGYRILRTQNTTATDITDFAEVGRSEFALFLDDQNTTVKFSFANLVGNGGADLAPADYASGSMVKFEERSGKYYGTVVKA